jgi:mannosylglycerate hydrolase
MNISVVKFIAIADIHLRDREPAAILYIKDILRLIKTSNNSLTNHLTFHAQYLKQLIQAEPDWIGILEKLIEERKVLCGPWYLLPNNCLAGSETLIRNLLYASKVCFEIGEVMKVGFSTFNCRINSQLPQIFNGFNIDTICVPISSINGLPEQFVWQGLEGSKAVVAGYFDHQSSTDNSQLLSSIEELVNKHEESQEYEIPQMIISYFDPRKNPDLIRELISFLSQQKDIQVESVALPDYFWKIKDSKILGNLKVVTHESIPHSSQSHGQSVISASLIHSENIYAEHLLQTYAEPWEVIYQYLVGNGSQATIQSYWESLMTLQQKVQLTPLLDKEQENIIGEEYHILNESLKKTFEATVCKLLANVQRPGKDRGYFFTIFNPLPYNRSEIVEVDLDLPIKIHQGNVVVEDSAGRKIPCWNTYSEKIIPLFEHHGNEEKRRFHCFLEVNNLPAMGYKTYRVVPVHKAHPSQKKNIAVSDTILENDFIRVSVNNNGTFNVFAKETGTNYVNLGYFVDTPYNEKGELISQQQIVSKTLKPDIWITVNNPLFARLKMEFNYRQNHQLENNKTKVILIFSIDRLSHFVDIAVELYDKAERHKIDLYFPANFPVERIYADTYFNVEDINACESIQKTSKFNLNFNSFIGFTDEISGFAIISKEIHNVEIRRKKPAFVAFPLLDTADREPLARDPLAGPTTYKYFLSFDPYLGGWESGQIILDAFTKLFKVWNFMLSNPQGNLPVEMEFLRIEPVDLCFSALKFGESFSSAVLRLFNPTNHIIQGSITTYLPLSMVNVLSLEELIIEALNFKNDYQINFTVLPKKIVTLGLHFEKR